MTDEPQGVLDRIAETLIENGMVLRKPDPEFKQRKNSIGWILHRTMTFAVLCSALNRYQIWTNWKASGYHSEYPDPYLVFEVNGTEFIAGCRKRVFTLSAKFPAEWDISELTALATADDITYQCDAEHSKSDRATKILIHAWGKLKLEEYLEILMRVAGAELKES